MSSTRPAKASVGLIMAVRSRSHGCTANYLLPMGSSVRLCTLNLKRLYKFLGEKDPALKKYNRGRFGGNFLSQLQSKNPTFCIQREEGLAGATVKYRCKRVSIALFRAVAWPKLKKASSFVHIALCLRFERRKG